MVRRIIAFSSSRLLWTAVLLATCVFLMRAQSADSAHAGSSFVVAPAFAVPAAPTSVAVGDVNGDGRPDLVMTHKASGSVTVFLGDGKGGFEPGVEYTAGTMPGHVLLKDLAGHGRLSIVVTDEASGAIEVLRGNGDGTFRKPASFAAIAHPVGIAAADFSGNEKVELAVASATGIALMASDGDGRFWLDRSIPLSHPAVALAAADLKGNGHHDLVVANADGTLTVLLNDGSGRFHALPAAKVAANPLTSVVAGDFRGDGRTDLAVTVGKANHLIVLLGKEDGSFEPGVKYTVGNGPAAVLVADLKGDGGSDLITVNKAANTFSVLAGKGDGTFKPAADFTAGNSPVDLAAADFNGDGRTDLAILNAGDATVSLPFGHGDGTFQAAPAYRSQLEQKAIAAGDLRGMGRPDLVVTNFCGSDSSCKSRGTAEVLFANIDGTYKRGDTYPLGNGPVAVALADLHGNKKLDLIAINQIDKTLMVKPGLGTGKFGESQTYSLAASPRALLVGDFNGDGRPDVAIATDCGRKTCAEPGNLDIWMGRGEGKLALAQSYTLGYSPDSIAAGDLRGTGHLDLLVANRCGDDNSCKSQGTASLLKGDGKGRFSDGGEIELGNAPSAIAIANLDGKGLSLIVAEGGSNAVEVLHGDGKGGFGAPTRYRVGEGPSSLAIGEFNGDNRPDVAVSNFRSSTVNVLYGTAKGTLRRAATLPVGAGPEAMVAISSGKGGLWNLVTANGNNGATPMGTDITLLKVHSDAKSDLTENVSAGTSPDTVDASEVFTVTLTGGTAPNGATGTLTFASTVTPSIVCAESTTNDNVVQVTPDNVAGSGSATCTTTSLEGAIGDTISAAYSGDGNYNAILATDPSAQTTLDINASDTSTAVSTPSSQSDGVDLVVTATVSPATLPANPANAVSIGGTGTFSIDGSPTTCHESGTDQTGMNSSGATASAQCTIVASSLSDGLHFISTSFNSSSSSNFNNSFGFGFITVGSTSKTVVTFSATPTVDSPVTITATVSKLAGKATGTPTGTVTFSGAAPGCSSPKVVVNLNGSGVATCTPTASSLTVAGSPYSVTATYTPDSASPYLTSNSTQSLAVAKAAPTTTPSSTPATATIDAPLTLNAVVKPPTGTVLANEVPIGGTVTFKNGGASIAGCTSAASVVYDNTTGQATATCTPTLSSLVATGGSPDSITATYSGDANYTAGTNSPYSLTIDQQSTNTTLTSGTNPSPVGTQVTFTATIAPPTGVSAAVHIGGTVTFTHDGGTAIPGCTSAASVSFSTTTGVGTATCTPTSAFFALGSYVISAAYSGDTNYTSSTSNTVTQKVNLAGTTTTVSAVSNSTVNQPLTTTLTATVAPNVSSSVPVTGSITFLDNSAPIPACPSAQTISSAKATCPNFLLTAGTHKITASYGGDTNYDASPASAAVSFTVAKANTSTGVSVSGGASSQVNAQITLNATVTPSPAPNPATNLVAFTAGGTVTFLDGTTTQIAGCIGVPVTVTTTGATASCNTTVLTHGPHTINATFNGDSNYNSGTSASGAAHTENTTNTTTALTADINPAGLSQAVTFTATVTPNSGSPTSPGVPVNGNVTFTDNSAGPPAVLCSSVPVSSGTASCPISSLTAGTHDIVAAFTSTDANYANSPVSNTVHEKIVANLTATALSASPSGASGVNQAVAFTDSITPSAGHTPTGTVTFTSNGSVIVAPNCGIKGVVQLSTTANGLGNFTALCTTPGLTLGVNNIVATYSGDNNYGSGVASGTQSVSPAASTVTTLSPASPSSVVLNSPISLTATVAPTAAPVPGGGVPLAGNVNFSDTTTSSNVPGCASVPVIFNAGTGKATAVCNSIGLAGGAHTIKATFTPVSDPSYTASAASAGVTQTITPEATAITSVLTSPLSAAVNQAVTFTANVVASPSQALPPVGGVALNGTVTFTATKGSSTITACSAAVSAVSGVATCTNSSLAPGSYSIKASMAANSNFQSSSGSATSQETIGRSPTTTVIQTPTTVSVDQPTTFIGTVTRQFLGFSLAGNLKFTVGGALVAGGTAQYTDVNTGKTVAFPNCDAVPIANAKGGIVSCTTNRIGAGSFPVTASYLGDANYGVSSDTRTLSVTSIPTKVAVTSANATAISGHAVTYTATLSPQLPFAVRSQNYKVLPVPFTGTMAFTHDGTAITECAAVKVTFLSGAATPTGVAVCNTTAKSTFDPTGHETISAVYTGDPSYPQVGLAQTQVTVQSFNLAVSATPQVLVAHGYTTATDPVVPTAITVSPAPFGGYSHSIVITCSAKALTAPSGAKLPTCVMPNGISLNVRPSGVQQSLPIVINATGATPGTYQIQVTGTNAKDNLHFTTTQAESLNVFVGEVTTMPTIVSGKSTSGTVDFVLPKGVSLKALSIAGGGLPPIKGEPWCVAVTGPALSSARAPQSLGITCSANKSSIAASSGTQTAPLTIGLTTKATPPGSYDLVIQGEGSDQNLYEALIKVVITL